MGIFSSAKTLATIAKLCLTIVDRITNYMQRKQLIDLGRKKQMKKNLKEANDVLSQAIHARHTATRKFESNDGLPKGYEYYRED